MTFIENDNYDVKTITASNIENHITTAISVQIITIRYFFLNLTAPLHNPHIPDLQRTYLYILITLYNATFFMHLHASLSWKSSFTLSWHLLFPRIVHQIWPNLSVSYTAWMIFSCNIMVCDHILSQILAIRIVNYTKNAYFSWSRMCEHIKPVNYLQENRNYTRFIVGVWI